MPLLSKDHPLLETAALEERRRLHELTVADQPDAERLQRELIRPQAHRLVDEFYQRILAQAQMAPFIRDQRTRKRLKGTFIRYLNTLGVDFTSQRYAAERLQVGLRHAEIGLPLTYYLCAYAILQQLLIDHLLDLPHPRPLIRFVLKITGYDTALAVEAYHLLRTCHLEDSIADLRQEKDRLTVAATTDPLTRLANRRHMLEVLPRLLERADERHQPLCLAIADLDDFKGINDHLGHLCGDRVLSQVGKRLREGLRDGDIIARYGGEEFMIALYGTDLPQAHAALERLRQRIAATTVTCRQRPIPVTLSIGLTQYHPGEAMANLIERADRALYRAKHSGKNRIESECPQAITLEEATEDSILRPPTPP